MMKSKIVYEVLASMVGFMIAGLICIYCYYAMTHAESNAFSSGYVLGLVSGICLFIFAQKAYGEEGQEAGYQPIDDGTGQSKGNKS